MVYKINYTDETKNPILLNDGSLDNTTDLTLIGKSYQGGFGDIIAENFVHLLENFSKETPPDRPIEGQLWYDKKNNRLMIYTANGVWKTTAGVGIAEYPPTGGTNSSTTGLSQTTGDIWLDTTTKQIYMFVGDSWNIIGNADQENRQISNRRMDSNGIYHSTLELVVNNRTVAIFSGSNTSWVPNSSGSTTERLSDNSIMALLYPVVVPGLNLYNRKNITNVTIDVYPPVGMPEYVMIGDFWYSSSTKELFIYKDQNIWEKISYDVKIENTNPTITTGYVAGQFWVNSTNNNLYVFNGNTWVKISEMSPTTKVVSRSRIDTNGIAHEVLETIIEGRTVSVDSVTDAFWFPAATEKLEEGLFMSEYFPKIGSGKNYLTESSYITYDPETNTVSGGAAGQVTMIRGVAERTSYSGSLQVRTDNTILTPSTDSDNLVYQAVGLVEFVVDNKQDIPFMLINYQVSFYYDYVDVYAIRLKRLEGNGIGDVNSMPGTVTTVGDNIQSNIAQYSRKVLDIPLFIYETTDTSIDVTYVIEAAFVPRSGELDPNFVITDTEFSIERYALGDRL